MFLADDLECGVPFAAARPQLFALVANRALADASRAAYGQALASLGLARPGPVRVRTLTCAPSTGEATVGLRWEVIGLSAGLFPVLDADLTLSHAGRSTTRLGLTGVYRPPFGDLDSAFDPAASSRVADLTVRALLRSVASYLTGAGAVFPPVHIPRPAEAS